MSLSRARWVFGKDLLATVRAISASPPIRVTSHIAVDVAYVVAMLLVEGVVCHLAEALAPEEKTLFEVETDTFEEEAVLKTSKMFEMRIPAQCPV